MYNVGDRVTRTKWTPNDRSLLRRGVVTEVYQSVKNLHGDTMTLYAIRWDDTGLVERGYMTIGLEPEPISVGGLGV